MRKSPYSLACFLIISFLSNIFYAQTGKLTGKLTEEGSNETLTGVSIRIININDTTKSLRGYSSASGTFTIKNIPVGTYIILFTSIGYKARTESSVTITEGEQTELHVSLTPAPIRGEALIVSASRREEKASADPRSQWFHRKCTQRASAGCRRL